MGDKSMTISLSLVRQFNLIPTGYTIYCNWRLETVRHYYACSDEEKHSQNSEVYRIAKKCVVD